MALLKTETIYVYIYNLPENNSFVNVLENDLHNYFPCTTNLIFLGCSGR